MEEKWDSIEFKIYLRVFGDDGPRFLQVTVHQAATGKYSLATASSILTGHAALKKVEENGQEKAAFLAVANNLGW